MENDIGEGGNKNQETSKKTMTKIQPPGKGVSMEVGAEARLRRMRADSVRACHLCPNMDGLLFLGKSLDMKNK